MENYYKTGTFAKMANVSERTIRYYDKIGLLKPSFIMANGYRQYTDKDLMKLQKILSLKHLGFSIEEIFPLVLNDDHSFKDSFLMQIELIEKRMNTLSSLKDSLKRMVRSIDNNEFNWDKLSELIYLTSKENMIVEQYKNENNLKVRIALHDMYSVNKQGWFNWIFSQIDFTHVYRLLEIGCGNGKLWENNPVNLRNREIFLSDLSEGMVEEVRNKIGNDYNCIVADCESIPFKDEYFDALIANHVLFYVKDINKAISEIQRCLRKEGIFYCSTYGKNHMKEISEIAQGFDCRVVLSEEKLYERFGLENGETILSSYFDKIEIRLYEDELIVDKAEAIVDYIMSCHGNQNEILGPRLYEFKNYVQTLIEKEGPIHISKQAGMFICKK